ERIALIEKVIELTKANVSQREIGRRLGVSASTVNRCLKEATAEMGVSRVSHVSGVSGVSSVSDVSRCTYADLKRNTKGFGELKCRSGCGQNSSGMNDSYKMVIALAEAVREAGGRAMLVGGCVRDELMGIEPKDWDVEVYGVEAERLKGILTDLAD